MFKRAVPQFISSKPAPEEAITGFAAVTVDEMDAATSVARDDLRADTWRPPRTSSLLPPAEPPSSDATLASPSTDNSPPPSPRHTRSGRCSPIRGTRTSLDDLLSFAQTKRLSAYVVPEDDEWPQLYSPPVASPEPGLSSSPPKPRFNISRASFLRAGADLLKGVNALGAGTAV